MRKVNDKGQTLEQFLAEYKKNIQQKENPTPCGVGFISWVTDRQ